MIVGLWHSGSGIGDQIFAYLAARIRAEDLGVSFGMIGEFKGDSFMQVDKGKRVDLKHHIEMPSGAIVIDESCNLIRLDTPYFNPEFFFVKDGTIIDGYGAQDERYFEHRLSEIREWLKVEPLEISPVEVAINFRGGEFALFPDLFLTKEYWDKALKKVNDHTYARIFRVHTDDKDLAEQFFDYPVVQDISLNWRFLRYSKEAVISNSAFAIIPRLLKHLEDPEATTIAPRYWARRNTKEWSLPSNYYHKFTYI